MTDLEHHALSMEVERLRKRVRELEAAQTLDTPLCSSLAQNLSGSQPVQETTDPGQTQ